MHKIFAKSMFPIQSPKARRAFVIFVVVLWKKVVRGVRKYAALVYILGRDRSAFSAGHVPARVYEESEKKKT